MKRLINFACLFQAITFVVYFSNCSKLENKAPENQENDRTDRITLTRQSIADIKLVVTPAQIQPLRRELVIPARLIVNQNFEALVGSLVQGRVSKVVANLGDHVVRGQELVNIEGVEIGEIKSLFTKAKAQLTFADATLKRQQALFEQNVGSLKALLEAQAEYDKASAEFRAADMRIHSIGLNDSDIDQLDKYTFNEKTEAHMGGILPIKSPIDGIVVERNVVLGQFIDPTTIAFKIINTSTLWVDGQIHEGDVNQVPRKPDISVVVPSIPGRTFSAKLIYFGETVDKQSRMVKIRASVANPEHLLKPEMFAEMHLAFTEKAQGIVIDAESIIKDEGEQYVFIAVSDTTFEKRDVVTKASAGERIKIEQGLQAGDKVVSKGAFLLKSELKKALFEEE